MPNFKLKFLCMLVLAGVLAEASPVIQPATVYDPEEAAGYEEGDMLLTDEQSALFNSGIQGRNGLADITRRWPNKTLVYKIIGNFAPTHIAEIRKAIAAFEARTCVRFREANENDIHYVAISSRPGGCFTAVGYQRKVQEMNLEIYPIGEGCFRFGTILHEFMHALGFYHEQSAAERDEYIRVVYENVVPGKEFNFQKYPASVVTNFDVGYDYDSCLHYRPGAFSINGEDTIVPLDPNAKIGQRVGFSKKDIDKINVMYKCPLKI